MSEKKPIGPEIFPCQEQEIARNGPEYFPLTEWVKGGKHHKKLLWASMLPQAFFTIAASGLLALSIVTEVVRNPVEGSGWNPQNPPVVQVQPPEEKEEEEEEEKPESPPPTTPPPTEPPPTTPPPTEPPPTTPPPTTPPPTTPPPTTPPPTTPPPTTPPPTTPPPTTPPPYYPPYDPPSTTPPREESFTAPTLTIEDAWIEEEPTVINDKLYLPATVIYSVDIGSATRIDVSPTVTLPGYGTGSTTTRAFLSSSSHVRDDVLIPVLPDSDIDGDPFAKLSGKYTQNGKNKTVTVSETFSWG